MSASGQGLYPHAAVICSHCDRIVALCSCEAAAPMLERHLVKACPARERVEADLFAQLQRRLQLYDAHALLWRGQQGRC